ncbi:MAG: proton-conducting transporter membrane subunit [Cytophagaceae bacterium]
MDNFLNLFILIPFSGFIFSLFVSGKGEGFLSGIAYTTALLNLLIISIFTLYWIWHGAPLLNVKDIVVVKTNSYEFFIDFYFDNVSLVYLFVGAFLTFLVSVYSKTYLHREAGFKRFYNTILLFYVGYSIIVLSGNFETLFVGWEILGLSSFLLIGFYRERYLPVKNAFKVFTYYRVADVAFILAMWMSHHLWHENITFARLNNYSLVHSLLESHSLTGVFISFMILISASVKSAQFPFSSWVPRAMEGPTPSSAIFYGSLAVHLGVFLLLRTFPFWEHQLSVRILIGVVGLFTCVVSTGVGRVQSSIKSQIAYASSAQIGLMFIEVALGLETIALIHFAGNAFLRSYQLLVSPSSVAYLLREQFFNFTPRKLTVEDSLPARLEYSFYILCLKEWNLDAFLKTFFWDPFKKFGRILLFMNFKFSFILFLSAFSLSFFYINNTLSVAVDFHSSIAIVFGLVGLLLIIKSFYERSNPFFALLLIVLNHFFIVMAVCFNEKFNLDEANLYLAGVLVSAIVGFMCLFIIKRKEEVVSMEQFQGLVYKHHTLSFVFLLSCLGLAGFPITPTFVAEDLIFSHIHEDQIILAFLTSISFVLNGISIIRIYTRVFLGPHTGSPFEMGYKST